MMTTSYVVFLAALVATLVLVFFSLRLRAAPGTDAPPSSLSKFFLVALRLAIGWHFFIEASEKLHAPNWSSEAYLRESTGPLAPTFRNLAGDTLADQLTVGADGSFPTALDARWQAYLDAVGNYYQLDEQQYQQAQAAVNKTKETGKAWLTTRQRTVPILAPAIDAPPASHALTMPARLQEYARLQEKVRKIEDEDMPTYGEAAWDDWKHAKENLNKWRGGLQSDRDLLDKEMKRGLRRVLLDIARQDLPVAAGGDKKAINVRSRLDDSLKKAEQKQADERKKKKLPDTEWQAVDAREDKFGEEILNVHRVALADARQAGLYDQVGEQSRRIVETVVDKQRAPMTSYDLVPGRVGPPVASWTLLDWSDFLVKWGLLAVGACLLVGLLTRTACVLGAVYLLMFYLAMPALPSWPEGPKAEGHYLFINKNIIEMLALLSLATFRTGRWAGLDGLLALLWSRRPEEIASAPAKADNS